MSIHAHPDDQEFTQELTATTGYKAFDALIRGEVGRDIFGVIWDRSIDKDIGNVEGCVLTEPALDGYELPDPLAPMMATNSPRSTAKSTPFNAVTATSPIW